MAILVESFKPRSFSESITAGGLKMNVAHITNSVDKYWSRREKTSSKIHDQIDRSHVTLKPSKLETCLRPFRLDQSAGLPCQFAWRKQMRAVQSRSSNFIQFQDQTIHRTPLFDHVSHRLKPITIAVAAFRFESREAFALYIRACRPQQTFDFAMPRITRAQLRAQETEAPHGIYEDPDTEQNTVTEASDLTQTAGRVLSELPNANSTVSQKQNTLVCADKEKGSKNHGSGKNRLNLVLAEDENILPNTLPDIIQDECPSDDSSAAEAAAKELRVQSPDLVLEDTTAMSSNSSAAAKAAGRALSRSPERNAIAVHSSISTPKFNPDQHSRTLFPADDSSNDSFEASIKKRTPAPIIDTAGKIENDSFVDDITSQSPSKFTARIEDSVEALDALEDAIEQASGELPTNMPVTPAKATNTKPSTSKPISKPLSAKAKQPVVSKTDSKRTMPQTTARTVSQRAQPRQSISATGKKVVPAGRPSLGGQTVPAGVKRVNSTTLSTSKPGFVPARSTKQPTKPTFTLPGEAMSAKMSAKREEMRLKKEAEEKKRSEFKARPAPNSAGTGAAHRRVSSIQPRENAASRARMDAIAAAKKAENATGKKAGGQSPTKIFKASSPMKVTRPVPRTSIVPAKSTLSRLSVPKARDSQAGQSNSTGARTPRTPANTSVPRRNLVPKSASPRKPISMGRPAAPIASKAPVKVAGSKASSPSTSGAETKKSDGARKVSKGKEVFNRGKLAEAEMQKVRKIKEEAAKKAREAAAERGRQASREWAEKMKKKNGTAKPAAVVEGAKVEPVEKDAVPELDAPVVQELESAAVVLM